MQRNDFITILALFLLSSPVLAASGNPFTGGAATPVASAAPAKKEENKAPAMPTLPPVLSSPILHQAPPIMPPPAQKSTVQNQKWKILGKMGEDQVALSGPNDDVFFQRDGSDIGDCFLLYPDISCDDASIKTAKARKKAAWDHARITTELEVERAKNGALEKKVKELQEAQGQLQTKLADAKKGSVNDGKEKPAPVVPDWLVGEYFNASISGTMVSLRRLANNSVIIRGKHKDWVPIAEALHGRQADLWEDALYKYALVHQGNFTLNLPQTVKGVSK